MALLCLIELERSEQPRGRVGITPGFALFYMEPLGEAHSVKELLWNLGHSKEVWVLLGPVLPSRCFWCEVTALCAGTWNTNCFGIPGAAEPRPGRTGSRCP